MLSFHLYDINETNKNRYVCHMLLFFFGQLKVELNYDFNENVEYES